MPERMREECQDNIMPCGLRSNSSRLGTPQKHTFEVPSKHGQGRPRCERSNHLRRVRRQPHRLLGLLLIPLCVALETSAGRKLAKPNVASGRSQLRAQSGTIAAKPYQPEGGLPSKNPPRLLRQEEGLEELRSAIALAEQASCHPRLERQRGTREAAGEHHQKIRLLSQGCRSFRHV